MRTTDAYADLIALGRPIFTTAEAATRWQTERRAASKRLRTLEATGLVRRIRRGLWALDPSVEPFVVVPYLTTPFPAYVSLWSALAHHGMIEQIPRQISAASLDRSRRIETTVGTYTIHHLAPKLFDGYEGSEKSGYVARPEKALFDTIYVRSAAGSKAYFPELSLPPTFDEDLLSLWTGRIESSRLRTLVLRALRRTLRTASRESE